MGQGRQISIEGFTPDEILSLPDHQLDSLAFTGEPVVFNAGSARVLGEFRITPDRLTVELAHIDGGGEGVLPTLWALAERYANKRGCREVEWIVHATNCANPNPKLRRVLERRNFQIRQVSKGTDAFYYLHALI